MLIGYAKANFKRKVNTGDRIGTVVRLDGKEERIVGKIKQLVDVPGKGYKDPNMVNHIHVELTYNGKHIDPTDKFTTTKGSSIRFPGSNPLLRLRQEIFPGS